MDDAAVTFAALAVRWGWREIPGCPGRFVLDAPRDTRSPEALLGSSVRVVHTLNTPAGLARKLAALGAAC